MSSYKTRTNGTETIEAFPETPLSAVKLMCPRGDIVRTDIPKNMVHGIFFRDIPCGFAYHYRKFGFVICLTVCGLVRDYQRCVWRPKTCRWLEKEGWMLR